MRHLKLCRAEEELALGKLECNYLEDFIKANADRL
jgi:hypothetical protein